jgi:hypothetical protein
MNNSLVKYNTVYSGKLKRKESDIKTFFKVIFCWTIPIAYLVHYRDKQKESNETIKALQGEIQRLDLTIENQAKSRRKQQESEQMTLEHVKKIIKTGNNVKLTETKTYNGSMEYIKDWLGGNYND